jgi:hypothetical protein
MCLTGVMQLTSLQQPTGPTSLESDVAQIPKSLHLLSNLLADMLILGMEFCELPLESLAYIIARGRFTIAHHGNPAFGDYPRQQYVAADPARAPSTCCKRRAALNTGFGKQNSRY